MEWLRSHTRRNSGKAQSHQAHNSEPAGTGLDKVVWYKEPQLRKLYILSVFLLVASATTGYDGMLVNTSQQMDLWKSYFPEHKNSNKLGILINMYNIGSITSFFIVPYMADRFGRKFTIAVGCVFMVTGAVVGAFCNGYKMYIAARFLLGFGNSMAQMCSPLLLSEICHPQHRGPLTTIYNCLWSLGSLTVSCIGWGTASLHSEWSWRSITLIQAAPSIIQLCGIWWIPESPRWLVSRDRSEEALQMLAKYHGQGDVHNTTVQLQWLEMKDAIQNEKSKNATYMDFFKTRGNRWRLLIILSLGVISQYSGNALFSNYINIVYEGAGITKQNQKLALSAGSSIMNLVVSIGSALLVDNWGRRPLFLLGTAGMFASFSLWTILAAVYENSSRSLPNGTVVYTNLAAGTGQIVFVWLFNFFYHVGFAGLFVAYALEILPYHLRAKGMMIMNITVQAVLALGNQTNVLAWNNFPKHWNFILFYAIWDLCEFIFVYFVYVETKGHTLEEMAFLFDGDDAITRLTVEKVEKEVEAESQVEHITTV